MPGFWVDTSGFNQIVGRTQSASVPESRWNYNPNHVGYTWGPDDDPPSGFPGFDTLFEYIYDGTTFAVKADDDGYQEWLSEGARRYMVVRDYDAFNATHSSKLSRECEKRITAAYGGYSTVHEIHRRKLMRRHANPSIRAALTECDIERNRLASRYEDIKYAVKALDLSQAAHRALFRALDIEDDRMWSEPLSFPTGWPTYSTPAVEIEQWNAHTTPNDIDQAAGEELEAIFGHMALAVSAALTGSYGTLADYAEIQRLARMIDRRRRATRGLLRLPIDARDPHLWGHDARVQVEYTHPADATGEYFGTQIDATTWEIPRGTTVKAVAPADATASVVENDDGTYTCTAEDGTTARTWTVRVASA